MITYVVGFAFDENKENVLLIKKTKPEWQAGLLNGVGGKIEQDETPLDAMIREFKEETDLDITNWEPTIILSGEHFQVTFFRAFDNNIINFKQTTVEMPILINLEDLNKEPVIYNLKWLIPLSLDNDIQKPLKINEVGQN